MKGIREILRYTTYVCLSIILISVLIIRSMITNIRLNAHPTWTLNILYIVLASDIITINVLRVFN